MRFVCCLIAGTVLTAGAQTGNPEVETNVNSRYTVETIELPPSQLSRLSETLRDRIQSLIGSKFDQEQLEEIARRIRRELRNRVVAMKVSRGSKPEHLKVVFEISERKGDKDVAVPRFVYHSKQNFTFGVDGAFRRDGHSLSFGILTDNDELVERYSGIRGGYGREGAAGGRLDFHVGVESWRAQWNGAVRTALEEAPEAPGIYRTRVHLRPTATIHLLQPLTLEAGVSLQRVQSQFPTVRHELASAAIGTLRFERRWELTPVHRHEVEAAYSLRTATRSLDSDFVYTRHHAEASYAFRGHREAVIASFEAGAIYGRAPLFERFTLGNSRTLRGWNRFDVDPLGGDRMAHGSLEYRYRPLRFLYDTGSVWRRGAPPQVRHSLAVGLTSGSVSGISFLVAFPVREGRIEPIFITGINF